MHLTTLLKHLDQFPKEAELDFETDAGPVESGFHVTELKHAKVSGIDCGGQMSTWEEVSLELMDGFGGKNMSVGKYQSILSHSIKALPQLANAEIQVEFSHGNKGLQKFLVEPPRLEANKVTLPLRSQKAICKAAVRSVAHAQESCCAPKSACC